MVKDKRVKNQKREIGKNLVLPSKNNLSPKRQVDEKLVTIEFQKEYDIFKSSWEERIFVKLYVEARTSGLLKEISNRDWKTLCALATFMDKEGNCYPSQRAIAKALGVSRQMANDRIQSLLKFRFKDQPVLLLKKVRKPTPKGGRWDNNHYKILPISNLKIFSGPGENKTNDIQKKPVSRKLDIGPVSRNPDTGKLDTNYNHTLNNNQLNNVKENAVFNKGKRKKRSPEKESLASYIAEQLEDDHSLGFYRRVVDNVSENLIYQALSEVKDTYLTGKIIKSRAAFFNTIIQTKAKENNINLRINKTVN